jgi:hypothetical protein
MLLNEFDDILKNDFKESYMNTGSRLWVKTHRTAIEHYVGRDKGSCGKYVNDYTMGRNRELLAASSKDMEALLGTADIDTLQKAVGHITGVDLIYLHDNVTLLKDGPRNGVRIPLIIGIGGTSEGFGKNRPCLCIKAEENKINSHPARGIIVKRAGETK